ncbi:MAG: Xylose isomerase-like TIM barrel [Elusimicrobia bacterium ADurb.Bin231]|nr:MAG: Xylose isomerase-like TIM barrel [Elusimicrobia bacterium ADurb.Bin231]
MKLGRNFTNTFVLDVLTEDDRNKILDGTYSMFSMNALGLMKFKTNIEFQIEKAKSIGLDHVELDCDVPNPYPDFSKKRRQDIKAFAKEKGITLSIHLPYSGMGVGPSVASIQELDRSYAVKLQKEYVDFAEDIGSVNLIMHPSGTIPFYYISDFYVKQFTEAVVKSFTEIGRYAVDKGMNLHIENNVSFDGLFVEPEECIDIVDKVRANGVKIYFNFDIGHWITRAEKGKEIPAVPEEKLKIIPADYICEFHLNDFIPSTISADKQFTFHPPLHTESGPLKKTNLEGYWKILKEKNPNVLILLETAFKKLDQVKDRENIIKSETAYIREIFK